MQDSILPCGRRVGGILRLLKEYITFGRQLFDGFRAQTERNIDQQRRSDIQPYLDQPRALPCHVSFNKWRIAQSATTCAQHFEILKNDCVSREGEDLLTPELEAELSAHTRDELACLGLYQHGAQA